MFPYIFSLLLPVKNPNLSSIVNGGMCMYFDAGTALVPIILTYVYL